MQPTVLLDYEFAVAQSGYVVRALIKLEGHAREAAAGRVPMNLAVVLDRSGSMAGEKLAAAREAAALLVRRVRPEDVVSVVAYDDEVQTVALPATGDAQRDLVRRIEAIECGGSTNLSGGWLRGRELVASVRRVGAVNRVLLLTDGQANVGITEPALLAGLCATAKRDGITTTTIGFGEGYDEKLLRAMADAGGANTYYIERPDQAPGVFEEELEGLLTLAAQNVAVEIRPGAEALLVKVHHDVPVAELPDEKGLRAELGDLYAREPKALLIEFFVPLVDPAADVATRIADVVIHAHVLTSAGGVERQEVRLAISAPLSAAGHEEPEVRREVLLLSAARAREEALRARERGDFEGGGSALRSAAFELMEALPALGPADLTLREEVADLEALAATFEESAVSEADAKYLAQRAYNANRGKVRYAEKIARRRPEGDADSDSVS